MARISCSEIGSFTFWPSGEALYRERGKNKQLDYYSFPDSLLYLSGSGAKKLIKRNKINFTEILTHYVISVNQVYFLRHIFYLLDAGTKAEFTKTSIKAGRTGCRGVVLSQICLKNMKKHIHFYLLKYYFIISFIKFR